MDWDEEASDSSGVVFETQCCVLPEAAEYKFSDFKEPSCILCKVANSLFKLTQQQHILIDESF